MSLLKHLLALSMCVSLGASCAQASPLGANFSTINHAFSTNFSTDHLIGAGLHFMGTSINQKRDIYRLDGGDFS